MSQLNGSEFSWVSWFQNFGRALADIGVREVGEFAPRVVISVPTGQFAVWMLTTGAFQSEITHRQLPTTGVRYSGWYGKRKRMDDVEFKEGNRPERLQFIHDYGSYLDANIPVPLKTIPDGTPEDRAGQGLDAQARDELRKLSPQPNGWMNAYADFCLSPVSIIGTGREYLHNQRVELLDKAPHWMDELSQVLLSEDSHQTSNPERMYFHPFMVFSAQVGDSRPWLRQMTPRLTIFTSWSTFERSHSSLFARSPQIILANRRVEKSLRAAEYVQDLEPDERVTRILKDHVPPPSVFVRSYTVQVHEDSGEIKDDEQDEVYDI